MTDAKMFQERRIAEAWARMNGRDYCLPFQFWRVEKLDNAVEAFAVAIRSRNDGKLAYYATED